MGGTDGCGKQSIFICPGKCERCVLTSAECPSRGELDPEALSIEMGMENFMSEVIIPRMKQSILERISPETIVGIHEAELFRLAQYCEIIEQAGEKEITCQELERRILALTPVGQLSSCSQTIKEKIIASVKIIASKLMEIKRRACRNQGIACEKCYMRNVCLQVAMSNKQM